MLGFSVGLDLRRFQLCVKGFTASFLVCCFSSAAAENALLHVRIKDAATGQLAPCTVVLKDANGKLVLKNDSFKSGFRSTGEFTESLPPGLSYLRVTRGFETAAVELKLNLLAGQTNEQAIRLERVVNLRKQHWYAGDHHVHMLHGEKTIPVSFDDLALTAKAEDLQFMSVAQAWSLPDPSPERLEQMFSRLSTSDCLLSWNLEAPKNYYKGDAGRCLGHCWNVGVRGRTSRGADVLKILMDASAWDYESSKPTFGNFESHQLIHEQGGAVCYTHPARWWMGSWGGQGGYPKVEQMRVSNMAVELPLDTVIGPTYDGIDVITGPGELEANAKAFELWVMLLNHGYRLVATGSSDSCFDRPGGGVPGTPRTYVFIPGKPSFSAAAKALAAGRTFVTTGPMLLASIDGQPPGSAIAAGSATHVLSLEGWASGQADGGLERMEILRNGLVWGETHFMDHPTFTKTNLALVESETAWYCVRLYGSAHQVAISSAFYFLNPTYRPPQPVAARVRIKVIDAESAAPIPCVIREIRMSGTRETGGPRHKLPGGEAQLEMPATARLRAEAKGYAPLMLSPFIDNPAMVQFITGLTDGDLLDWRSYERIKEQLRQVELIFRLERR